ncbi:MAG: hypothetical protein ACFFDW_02640 [Candidatus Thorarchaeota archaeon]
MPRFLAKSLLTLEPGLKKDEFHQALREISAHNKSNLLEMIGVDPVIFRSETEAGTVDLQVWITTLPSSSMNRAVMPFYFTGARKYLFMCSTQNAVNFVSEVIELASDQMNALNEIVILFPTKGLDFKYSKVKKEFEAFFKSKLLKNYSFHRWESSANLAKLFEEIIDNLVRTIPEEMGFAPVGFDLQIVEEMVRRHGYAVNENHEVVIIKDGIVFRIDLHRNTVFVELTDCFECDQECKVTKKLCILVADKGFANISGLGDLRILSILYAIEDGTIFHLKGEKPNEDINFQLNDLKQQFAKKCPKIENKKR